MYIRFLAIASVLLLSFTSAALAAVAPLNFTVNVSEPVVVTGAPRIAIDVGGVTRYADYSSGSGSSALQFTYTPVAGDVDMDGITLVSPVELNGGTIRDNGSNDTGLTYTLPATAGIKVNYPSLSMDFIGDRYTLNDTSYASLPAFLAAAGGTFSRASGATYFDSSGTLQTVAANVPRFDHNPSTLAARGLQVEETRTNLIWNSQMSGLSPGDVTGQTISHWLFSNPIGGTVETITGTGIQNGIPYIDLRFNIPTNISGSDKFPSFAMPAADYFNVSNGQRTSMSGWFGISSYSATGGVCTVGFSNRSLTAAGVYIAETSMTFTSTKPYAYTRTPVLGHGATAGKGAFSVYVAVPNGVSCDITVRLGGLQLEKGYYPTSYIPTVNAIATRNEDILNMPTGGWYSAAQGTLLSAAEIPALGNIQTPGTMGLDDGTISNAIHLIVTDPAADQKAAEIFTGGVLQFSTSGSAVVTGTPFKQGLAYALNNTIASMDGVLGSLDTAVTVPSVSILRIGNRRGNTNPLNGYIKSSAYYPVRVSNSQLQLMTQ